MSSTATIFSKTSQHSLDTLDCSVMPLVKVTDYMAWPLESAPLLKLGTFNGYRFLKKGREDGARDIQWL